MASPWDAFPEVGQSPDRPTGGGVILSDPYQERGDARDEVRTDIAVEGSERDARRETRDIESTAFDQSKKLRDEYNALPAVKDYGTVLKNLDIALHTSPTKAGDQDLIYALAQLRDPMGSVREGDAATIEGGQSFFQQQLARLKSELGDDGRFDPEYRNALRQEAIGRLNSANRAYISARQRYRALAEQSQFDPQSVVGEHAGSAFLERFREYDRQNGLEENPQPEGGRGPIPGATPDNLAFDIDTGTGAFGSQIEAPRLTPEQQGALDAFLRANSGNPNFGPEQLSAFYQSLGIQGGAMAGDDAFFEAVRSGSAFGTAPNYEQSDEARRQWAEDQVRQQLGGDTIGGNVALESGLFPWTDELMGVRGGVESLLRGDGFTQGYQDTRDIERAAVRMSEEEHGVVPKLVGSLLTPAGLVSRTNLARDALAIGAAYGAGEGEGLTDTVGKTVTGGALGYGAGKVIDTGLPALAQTQLGQRASSFISDRRAARQQAVGEREAFADAAERQGLDYLAADIPGATKAQFATSVAKSTLGGIPLSESAMKIAEKARTARDRIAGNVGNAAADDTGAGQAVKKGMEAWERKTEGRGGELYEAIPIQPNARVDLSTTRQTLGELNNSITSNPELAALVRDPRMVAYQNALESGDLTWGDIKKFRSFIGEKAGRPTLQQDTSKDSLDALYGALSKDIERAASAHSPEAAKAFSRANNYWRGRQTRLRDVMTRLVGKDGNMNPADTFAQIERWSKAKGGDFSSLARAVRSLPEDEANTLRATIIDRLGDANPGAQGAANDNFSPDVFLTQWAKLSDRAKGVLFQGEHRKALDDLATVFEGTKFSRGFDNTSRTAIGVNATALGGVGLASIPTAVALSALQFGGGALLASPRFARWLVALSKKPNPSAQLAHVNQLTALARSEPVIANDIFSLQERLADAFAQPQSLRAAAEENDDVRDAEVGEGKRDDAQ